MKLFAAYIAELIIGLLILVFVMSMRSVYFASLTGPTSATVFEQTEMKQ
jgi:hypothetical protein